jgi:membrane associated rhomboid family serine protease
MPPGVLNLMIINAILFVTKILAQSHDVNYEITGTTAFENAMVLHHPFSPDFHFYQYITSLFMHANGQHIVFNMFGLWMFGHMVENAYGTKRFLIFYLVCGIGASLIFQVWESIYIVQTVGGSLGFWATLHMYPYGILLGASGAVFGLTIGAAMLFPNTEMYMMFIPIAIKLKWLAAFYAVAELYNSWQQPGDGVAHLAHVGGMIFGFILVKIYARNKKNFY